jgi:23S rRNA (adenine2030-N6)-methyltransferase
MLSYRHAFHAGNHADVLKHLVLMLCIEHMNGKDKPYLALDTHAGAGMYSLETEQAKRTGEFREGIARLWEHKKLPEPLEHYRTRVRELNGVHGGGGRLQRYPGSPWIMSQLARETDRLRFCELHSTDFALLRRQYKEAGRRVSVEQADGFEVLKAALPPVSRRGLVLIDPSYEIRSDYMKVIAAIKDAQKRFATGTLLVWHPLMPTLEARQLPDRLRKACAADWLHATLTVRAPSTQGRGMHGSGMFVVNPPWTLAAALNEALPVLASMLALDEHAAWQLDGFERKQNDARREHGNPEG